MPSYFAFKWISQCSCFVSLHLFCICNPADSSQNCDPIQLSTSSLFIIELTGSRIIRRALGKKIPWCTVHFSPGADLGNTAPFMLVKGGCLWEQPTTTLCHCCPWLLVKPLAQNKKMKVIGNSGLILFVYGIISCVWAHPETLQLTLNLGTKHSIGVH